MITPMHEQARTTVYAKIRLKAKFALEIPRWGLTWASPAVDIIQDSARTGLEMAMALVCLSKAVMKVAASTREPLSTGAL